MADEAITWPAPPDVTDATDGAQSYNMGRVFTLTEDALVVGVEWRVPDNAPVSPAAGSPAGGAYGIALWNETTSDQVAFKVVTPTPGGVQQFLFDEADFHNGLTTETLQATIYTNHYVYASGDDAGSTSPSGTIVAGASKLAESNVGAASAPRPVNSTGLNFYVSPIVRLDGDHITTGTAPVEVTATGETSTTRVTARTAPVSVTATATTATGRTTSGTIAAAVTASATSGTSRVSSGVTPVTVTAAAATSTVRTTTGTAAVAVTAGSYSAAGAKGPRLISRRGQGRIVTRAQAVS